MPSRPSLPPSTSAGEAGQEVVCPLRNQDDSACRKRCLGEKRFRSMQEHIRRAHPEYYIPKLPATKESFELMITSPPHDPPEQDPNHANHHRHHSNSQRQQQQQTQPQPQSVLPASQLSPHSQHRHHQSDPSAYHGLGQHDGGYYPAGDAEATVIYNNMQAQQRSSDEYRRGSLIPAASAAAALAQLHYHRPDPDWGGGGAGDAGQSFYADLNNHGIKSNHYHVDPALDDPFIESGGFPVSSSSEQPGLLPGPIDRSSPDRLMTLPPLQRSLSRQYGRPRKSSLTQQARMAKHERRRSRELAKRSSGDRKAFSAEPSAASLYGKRWEDLIDAAASATEEEGSRDLTPIPASPYHSPQVASRTSLPPFALGSQFQSFQASPLNRALTPPPPDTNLDLAPFPSVESSLSSVSHQHHDSADSTGSQFHIMNPNSLTTPSDTSPIFNPQHVNSIAPPAAPGPVQIYCAGCRRLSILKDAYACTNCICGLCGDCVSAIINGQSNGRMSTCPRCSAMHSGFKPFQLDLR